MKRILTVIALLALVSACEQQRSDKQKKEMPIAANNMKESAAISQPTALTKIEPYAEKDGRLRRLYNGTDVQALKAAVSPSLWKILKGKDQLETSADYAKRRSLAGFDPSPAKAADLYAIAFDSSGYGIVSYATPRIRAEYNADRETMSVKIWPTNSLYSGLCEDKARHWDHDAVITKMHRKVAAQEHPISCTLAYNFQIAISSKNRAFQKPLVFDPKFDGRDPVVRALGLTDSFKVPKDKAKRLAGSSGSFDLGVLFVGHIDPDLKLADFDWYVREMGNAIPFQLKHIVYFDRRTGEIWQKSDY